jgi:hypothetical protein
MTTTKKPYYEYPAYHTLAAKLLRTREQEKSVTHFEFNPDWVHPDLVRQLKEVDTLLVLHGGLTGAALIATIIQRWEETMSGTLEIAYSHYNAGIPETYRPWHGVERI